ncbi:DUF1631 domain-containing protein [Marinobacter nanhaiticus D15-8W]|uniref:DUF1631 domain-containing protein n=1 Tax=Marinobacter nanhaiticus D15-8W TaxID=626887 RepID=N6W900_9GAMM|nr:DUF1631 domain-containing protein [Marinobacter nanhaiticus]ENO16709.1 DUF1631 domain-containing protein [Marinobacter nanhaiticus D15-8W]BES72511.1 DUF1631 domain-containing protein [Marinobacter nanhaiticus D15-8W]
MNKQSGIHYLHEHKGPGSSAGLPKEISKIRETVVAGLGDLLQGAFDAVDDSLFELANNARSNNEQNRYFEAMREIRIKRKGVEKHFQTAVSQLFLHPPRTTAPEVVDHSGTTADTLSLIQNDELEEQVALNAMISKSRAYFQGPLIQLQARFSSVYPNASDDDPVNPLAPEHLCGAFVEAAQALEIQIRERLIVLKQFDRYVVSNLGMLLDEANRILIQAGVIPNFRFHGKTGQTAQKPQSEAPKQPATDTTSEAPGAGADRSDAIFEQIRQLLAQQRDSGGMPRATNPNLHVVGGAELFQLVAHIPHDPNAQATDNLSKGEPIVVDLHEVVQHLLQQQKTSDGKPAALSESDEDLINLVSMLFEFILDDYNLSPPIQVLISRLQIPILKVVIKDKTFFSRATHPARKLLNALARAGIGWSESDEKTRDKLYEQIHNIVLRILNEFDGDITLFEQLNEEFDQFLARENRKATLVEQRTRESERGRIKSQKAQETVDQLLQEKLRRHQIPDTIRNILINGWSRVMFLAYLRNDVEHRWNQSVRVVDDLIWCLHPHLEDDERDQWVRVVPGLLKNLRAGLEEVSYNSTGLDAMMSDLKHELTEAFRAHALAEARTDSPYDPHPAPINGESAESLSEQEPSAIERQQEIEDAATAEYINKIDEIAVGHWVEFNLVNGARFRCKLSAIIEEADCFVFVNRMGLKVIEKTRTELAHEMRRGRMTILEQGALIDRALDAVVGSLRRSNG